MTLRRYRCIFWGFFFSCFSFNLFGLKILPGFIALGIFAYGIYGLYSWREDETYRAAAIAAAAAAMLDFFSTLFAWLDISLPAYGYYIPLCVHCIALGCTFFLLFNGLQKLFCEQEGTFPRNAAVSCGHGQYVLPVLYTLAIILYGTIMVLYADWREYLVIAAGILELCTDLYVLYLIAHLKAYLKYRRSEAGRPEAIPQQEPTAFTDCPLDQPPENRP